MFLLRALDPGAHTANMQLVNADLLAQIENISADGLDPMHSRATLVLKMRKIYKLAVSAETPKIQRSDSVNDQESE